MIEIAGQSYAFSDLRVIAALIGALVVIAVLWLLISSARKATQSTLLVQDVAAHISRLSYDVTALSQGQSQLSGNIQTVSDAQANAQVHVIQTMETRLAEVQSQVADRLAENARRSALSLSEMQERMKETLSGSSEKTTQSLTQLRNGLRQSTKRRQISKSCRAMFCPCRISCRTSNGAGCSGKSS